MKSTEILQALKLSKNKQTTNYCGKLANLFEFIKLVKNTIAECAIVETDLTIGYDGKLIEYKRVESGYKESLLNHYRYNDKQVTAITKKECELRCEKSKVVDLLWKKRKNKDNSVLESEKEQIETELTELDSKKEVLINAEKNRLQSITANISEMRKELNLFTGCKILVETKPGIYSFYLPIDNLFYYEVCRILNITFEVAKVETVKIFHTISVESILFKSLDNATKFISRDELRPAMQHVCMIFDNNLSEIVATDAHRLFRSQSVKTNQEGRTEILISEKSAKAISKITVKSHYVNLHILEDKSIMIEGQVFNTLDARFPDYRCVMPEYDMAMEFDKAAFINNVKKVMVYSNKSTNQVTFHLNGSIALSACDVDFSFESEADMPYITKQFPDTDIAFNGKFLIECLSIFKEKTVKMFTDGYSTKAGIFTNDIDTVLLMPLMMNN